MNMFEIRVFLVRFFSLFFIVCSSVSSADLKFITVNVEPWASFDKSSLEVVGVFPKIIQEIEFRTNHRISVSLASLSFERIDRELMSGRKDCVVSVRSEKRDRFTILGESFAELTVGVIAHNSIKLDRYEDLYGLNISANKAWSKAGEFLDDDKLSVEFESDYEVGLNQVRHRRVDAVAGPIKKIQHLARISGISDFLGQPLILGKKSIYLQCSKKFKGLSYIDDVNNAIRDMMLDATLEKIITENGY